MYVGCNVGLHCRYASNCIAVLQFTDIAQHAQGMFCRTLSFNINVC